MEDLKEEKPEAIPEAVEEGTVVYPERGKEEEEKKTLTPEEMQKRRKFIVIPVFILIFLGVMY